MAILDRYSALPNASAKYSTIENIFSGWNGYSMPMSMRKLIQVQQSAYTIDLMLDEGRHTLGDGRSCRVKALMAGTLGAACSLVARIIRIGVFTLSLPVGVPVRIARAQRYGLDGAVSELFKKYRDEWFDLGVTILSIPLGIAKMFSPKVLTGMTDAITNVYLRRVDRRMRFTAIVAGALENYNRRLTAAADKRATGETGSINLSLDGQ